MLNTNDLRKGMLIRVSKDLSTTKRRYNLDDNGYMLNMAGKTFRIREVSGSSSIRIKCDDADRTFIFDIHDIEMPKVEDPDPIIFEFDPQHLDM